MSWQLNKWLQQTRPSALPLRSPLSRQPLGRQH